MNPIKRKKLYKQIRKFAEIDLKHRFVSVHVDQTLSDKDKKLLKKMHLIGFFTQLRFFK